MFLRLWKSRVKMKYLCYLEWPPSKEQTAGAESMEGKKKYLRYRERV